MVNYGISGLELTNRKELEEMGDFLDLKQGEQG